MHRAGQKAASYIPGTEANKESKDRQYEQGQRSTPGTGTGGIGSGTTGSGYGTGTGGGGSGTGGIGSGTTGSGYSGSGTGGIGSATGAGSGYGSGSTGLGRETTVTGASGIGSGTTGSGYSGSGTGTGVGSGIGSGNTGYGSGTTGTGVGSGSGSGTGTGVGSGYGSGTGTGSGIGSGTGTGHTQATGLVDDIRHEHPGQVVYEDRHRTGPGQGHNHSGLQVCPIFIDRAVAQLFSRDCKVAFGKLASCSVHHSGCEKRSSGSFVRMCNIGSHLLENCSAAAWCILIANSIARCLLPNEAVASHCRRNGPLMQ